MSQLCIDATTGSFDDYGAGHVGVQRASCAGASGLCSRQAVITMSEWAADSVRRDYGIAAERVHVVPGGANLDEQALALLPCVDLPPEPSLQKPLRLGFLGKEWERKGGPFVLSLAEALVRIGIPAVVRAIGPSVQALRQPLLQPLGFISKKQLADFVRELRSWHFTPFSSRGRISIVSVFAWHSCWPMPPASHPPSQS